MFTILDQIFLFFGFLAGRSSKMKVKYFLNIKNQQFFFSRFFELFFLTIFGRKVLEFFFFKLNIFNQDIVETCFLEIPYYLNIENKTFFYQKILEKYSLRRSLEHLSLKTPQLLARRSMKNILKIHNIYRWQVHPRLLFRLFFKKFTCRKSLKDIPSVLNSESF